jgi:hypothetical protein
MKALRSGIAISLLSAVVMACGGGGEADEDAMAAPTWVDSVAAVANAIEARPAAADSVLTAHAMSRARLDSLLYEIAEDPALTAAYREARGR